jgi:hypothetical protein
VASWSAVLALIGAAVAAAWGRPGPRLCGVFIADDLAAFAKAAIYGMSAISVSWASNGSSAPATPSSSSRC